MIQSIDLSKQHCFRAITFPASLELKLITKHNVVGANQYRNGNMSEITKRFLGQDEA